MSKEIADELNKRFVKSDSQSIISFLIEEYAEKLAFSSSLGAEDQVLTHIIWSLDPDVRIFTLDTGRLFQETYELLDRISQRYGRHIEVIFPASEAVERMVSEKGINLFYKSVENRKECCNIRKTEPLLRALKGVDAWITGIRRDQSITRYAAPIVEWNDEYKLIKINPLRDWTIDMVWDFIRENDLPYNPLHDRGFPSIGCAPCTRAINPGEEIRAGRWWWELPENKECGIHTHGK